VIAHLDANLAPGHVVSVQAMKMAVKKAKTSGIGFVLVRNSTHWGRAPTTRRWPRGRAAPGSASSTPSPNALLGNPAPGSGISSLHRSARALGEPVVLDMAMSQAAFFKVVLYNRKAKSTPGVGSG